MLAHTAKNALAERRLTYTALIGTFGVIFAAFNLFNKRKNLDLRPLDVALLGLAVTRLGRLVAFDRVLEPYRAPFTQTVPDATGAGETVEPKGSGWRQAIGEMISCPVCAGTWIAAGLVYGLEAAPRPTRVFLAIMSATGLGELLNALTEALTWVGRAARKLASS